MSPETFETGQVYTMYIRYRKNNGEYREPPQGTRRPVVIFKNPLDDKVMALQTTKQKKPHYLKNGVLIEDLDGTGFRVPSVIRLEYHSRYEIEDLASLKGPIGKLSEEDTDRLLDKFIKKLQREYQRENDFEL